MDYSSAKMEEPHSYDTLFVSPGVKTFPQLRFMGSKYRLLPWIEDVLSEYTFETALDAFSGSGCVSYLLKCMGKRVITNDFLNFTGKKYNKHSCAGHGNQDFFPQRHLF